MPSSSVMDLTSPYPFFFVFVIPESKFQRLLAGLGRCGSAREGLVWKGKHEDPSSISSIHIKKLDVAMYACSHDTGKRPRAETKGLQGGLIGQSIRIHGLQANKRPSLRKEKEKEKMQSNWGKHLMSSLATIHMSSFAYMCSCTGAHIHQNTHTQLLK